MARRPDDYRNAPPEKIARRNKTMRALRRRGVPVAEIARKYHVSDSRVRQITAGNGPTDRSNLLRYPPELYVKVIKARGEGMLIREIAAHYSLPRSTASAILRRHQEGKRQALAQAKELERIMRWLEAPP